MLQVWDGPTADKDHIHSDSVETGGDDARWPSDREENREESLKEQKKEENPRISFKKILLNIKEGRSDFLLVIGGDRRGGGEDCRAPRLIGDLINHIIHSHNQSSKD
ncbi:Hypothetical predicted protein [Octopus vulgaris]|uniref:Uncharacterized protein n=1 Tax=Octopus vulgaris TaxID=6645 RepID=A0AA36BUH5_OCTVU|nr:Hypothetical predicted protein [Octopus vulgaris]